MVRLYVDIETIPGPVVPSIEELELHAPKTLKKPETIRAWAEENQDTEYRKQALDSMTGEILAIGYAFDDDEPECLYRGPAMPGEEDLLTAFELAVEARMHKHGSMKPVWIGHNVRGFDLPWLWRKALKYRLHDLAGRITRGRYDRDVEDTMELWAADYKDRVGLARLAAFLGLPGKSDGMTGGRVYDLWQAGEMERIARYCLGDVALARDVWRIVTHQ